MKVFSKFFLSILALSTCFVSCVNEVIDGQVTPEITGAPVYTAYVDAPETKAVLDKNVSKWSGEEYIQIIGESGTYKFGASVSGTASTAAFSYMGDGQFSESEVMAVYPYANGQHSGNLSEKYVTNVTIPSNQTAVAGSYDPSAAVAVAYSTDDKLTFKNAVALLKFTMGSSGVKNVTVWGDMTKVEIGTEVVQTDNLFLTVHDEWKSDDAWFAAYFFKNDNTYRWVKMELVSGNMYSCPKQEGYPNVIFCRMNPANTSLSWDNKWNQTSDLTIGSNNHYTITKPWDSTDGSWSTYDVTSAVTTTLGVSGTGKVYYNDGDPIVSGFSSGYVSMSGNFVKGKTYYIAVAPVVFEKGFTVEFSNVGDYDKYKVKSTSKKIEFKRNTIYDLGSISSGKETGFYTDPAVPNADEPCTIYYKAVEGDALYGQTSDLYAHVWLRNNAVDSHGPAWGINTEKYKLTKIGSNLWSMEMSPSVREWFNEISPIGTTPVQKIGIIARTEASDVQTADNFLVVTDDLYGVDTSMPAGVKHGINYIDNSTVTLVLYDRDNQGKPHDFCNLLWDENWWGDSSMPKKPLNYDDESGCWWITLTDLNPDKQYKFQYQLGYGNNVTVTTCDPYTEIVYDTYNDKWISDYAYPGLAAEYGDTHYGRDNGLVSAFKINKDTYNWQISDYRIEDKNDLVIYELLVRDFTDNAYGEGNLRAIMEGEWQSGKNWLDYLQNLGVNVIELMPVQEFDGNNSWGYANHAYFALDKIYGNRTTYKKFIDECHKRGMAVFFDVVFNHATGAYPYAAMYWDGTSNKTAYNNPWFNVDATHQYSVGHQWNHSNPMVREQVKRVLEYLLTEYKVDGFRFDLTKGFTQDSYNIEGYNQERVNYLKEYAYHIKCVDDNAVMICEHFVDAENKALGDEGIKVWRNMNEPYYKAMKRDMSVADFSGVTHSFDGNSGMRNDDLAFGTLVGYMESHDEERTNYEGQWAYDGSSIPFATRIERAKANAAFFLLTPGPKMIWQFGEIGYDVSIYTDNDRTGKKPWKTSEYLRVAERKSLYDTYSMLLKFRRENPRFFDNDVNFRWYVGGNEQKGRYMFARSGEGKHFALFANFGTGNQTISVSLPEGVGKWYDYTSGAEWNGGSHAPNMAEGQFYLLVSDRNMCRQ